MTRFGKISLSLFGNKNDDDILMEKHKNSLTLGDDRLVRNIHYEH